MSFMIQGLWFNREKHHNRSPMHAFLDDNTTCFQRLFQSLIQVLSYNLFLAESKMQLRIVYHTSPMIGHMIEIFSSNQDDPTRYNRVCIEANCNTSKMVLATVNQGAWRIHCLCKFFQKHVLRAEKMNATRRCFLWTGKQIMRVCINNKRFC